MRAIDRQIPGWVDPLKFPPRKRVPIRTLKGVMNNPYSDDAYYQWARRNYLSLTGEQFRAIAAQGPIPIDEDTRVLLNDGTYTRVAEDNPKTPKKRFKGRTNTVFAADEVEAATLSMSFIGKLDAITPKSHAKDRRN